MNKKIITIAEIVFALVFVILLAVFMATINSKGNQANNQLVDTLDSTGGSSIKTYQQYQDSSSKVKGSVVVNACNNYRMIGSDTKLEIIVNTGTESTSDQKEKHYGYYTGANAGDNPGDLDKDKSGSNAIVKLGEEIGGYTAPISTAAEYINPSGEFTVECIKNKNDVYIGIEFTQVIK